MARGKRLTEEEIQEVRQLARCYARDPYQFQELARRVHAEKDFISLEDHRVVAFYLLRSQPYALKHNPRVSFPGRKCIKIEYGIPTAVEIMVTPNSFDVYSITYSARTVEESKAQYESHFRKNYKKYGLALEDLGKTYFHEVCDVFPDGAECQILGSVKGKRVRQIAVMSPENKIFYVQPSYIIERLKAKASQ